MFDIVYRPGILKIPKSTGCIEVVCGEEMSKFKNHLHEVLRVNKATIYEDLQEVDAKIVATSILWAKLECIYLIISDDVLKMSSEQIEHVVSHVCGRLGTALELLNKKWTIGHCSTVHRNDVSDIVDRIKKVYAGRILAMYPANIATPTMLSETLAKAFIEVGAEVLILNDSDLHTHGFGLITGIGDSATNPARMLVVRRDGNGKKHTDKKCIGVVGKGVTFDSGGLAMKPFKHMHDMKFDKIGAVYGCMVMLYFLENRDYDHHEFVGVFPFVENAVSHRALRPGDVITSFCGKTVEITNPDAEGRLILADALSYIQKYDVDFVVDMATLTGHASQISCWHAGMFYTHTRSLIPVVKNITNAIGERMLDMPYWSDRKNVLKSNVADLTNSPLKCSDSTVAAMFLDEFVKDNVPWVHVDLAHEIDTDIPNGNGVRTVIRIIEHICKKK